MDGRRMDAVKRRFLEGDDIMSKGWEKIE